MRRRRRSSWAPPTGGAVPDTEHVESARWLRAFVKGVKAAALDCVLRFWSPSRPVHRGQEALTREFHLRLLVLLCVEEVARASTSSHLSCHFDGFMVHRDVPPVTSSQQFIDDLAPADHHGVHHPFRLEEALLPVTGWYHPRRRATWARERYWALVPRCWGSRPACGCGEVDGPTVRDWLAAKDGVPANAVVMRPAIVFEIPKDAGSPLILIVVQDPGGGVPV